MAAPRAPVRRRQRSVRVTAAVVVFAVATVSLLAALPTRSSLWVSLSSITALALSGGALRILWTEVLESRRENVADRAAAATAYKNLFGVRAAEHADFITAMTERLAEAHLSQRELEGLVAQQETRAQLAEARLSETEARLRTLEETLATAGSQGEAVVDLVAWDEQIGKQAAVRSARTAPALEQA